MYAPTRSASTLAVRLCVLAVLALSLLILAGCQGALQQGAEPQGAAPIGEAPQGTESQRAEPDSSALPPSTEVQHGDAGTPAGWTVYDEIVYIDASGSTPQVRRGSDQFAIAQGTRFELSSDGSRVAVLDEGRLYTMNLDGTAKQQIASKVTWFQWRPGTHDLFYLAYSDTTGKPEWRWASQEGRDVAIGENRFPPSVSPGGTWLLGRLRSATGELELTAISLPDLARTAIDDRDLRYVTWFWDDALVFTEDGHRVGLLTLPSGEQRTLLESDYELYGAPHWSPDRSKIAIETRENGLSIWSVDEGLLGLCPGDWEPITWSGSGRYLIVKQGMSGLSVLDTTRLDSCTPTPIPGTYARYVEWHPTADVLVGSFIPEGADEAQVQVWGVSDGEPVLMGVVGQGESAVWLVPSAAPAEPRRREEEDRVTRLEEPGNGSYVHAELGVPPDSESSDQVGPYYTLLKLDAAEVERRLGKPSTVTNLGPTDANQVWQYDDLGLTLYITMQRSNNKQIVTTLFQDKGLIVGSLSVGDSEEEAVEVAGPIKDTMSGERIAQMVFEDAVFTLTLENGRIVEARIEPVGRED